MAHILIIDDDPQIRTMLRKILEPEGHEIEDVGDSDSGLKLQIQNPFDLLIVDIILPEKEGITTIMEFKRTNPDLKIIAISGGGSFEPWGYLDIAKRVGAHHTIPKPFSPADILDAIKDLLE